MLQLSKILTLTLTTTTTTATTAENNNYYNKYCANVATTTVGENRGSLLP